MAKILTMQTASADLDKLHRVYESATRHGSKIEARIAYKRWADAYNAVECAKTERMHLWAK